MAYAYSPGYSPYPYGYTPYYPANLSSPPPPHRSRSRSHSHSHSRGYGDNVTILYPPAGGDRGRGTDRIADELHNMRLDRSYSRGRYRYSRSRTRSRSRHSLEREVERLKRDLDQSTEKEHHEDIIERWKGEQAEKERKKKKEYEEMKDRIRMEEVLKKEEEERKYKEFEALQEKKRAEEALKKKQKEDEILEGTREQLHRAGYTPSQIDKVLDRAQNRDKTTTTTTTTALVAVPGHHPIGGDLHYAGGRHPIYPRASTEHISIEILSRYGIPWRYDTIDKRYIIILQEMDQAFFEVLADETRHHRHGSRKKKTLVIEEPKRKFHTSGDLLLVRKRSGSRSRSRSRSEADRYLVLNR